MEGSVWLLEKNAYHGAASGCQIVLIETVEVGIGQSEMDIASLDDITLLVINEADMGRCSEAAQSDRVLETVAAENQGIEASLDRILALETEFCANDEFIQRRHEIRRLWTGAWNCSKNGCLGCFT
ncbi:MAG: hypothetical protein D3903_08730 [Candidatus Electrothrix sp. GM3_4]|nr:hypothetical protein [Candidatus Electrothrix sp. GM3_4]